MFYKGAGSTPLSNDARSAIASASEASSGPVTFPIPRAKQTYRATVFLSLVPEPATADLTSLGVNSRVFILCSFKMNIIMPRDSATDMAVFLFLAKYIFSTAASRGFYFLYVVMLFKRFD